MSPSEHTPTLKSQRVLLTGANGFVGRALLEQLSQDESVEVLAAVRRTDVVFPDKVKKLLVPSLEDGGNWEYALQGVDIVIHAAARVHVMDDRALEPLAEFRRTNVEGTLKLARQAAASGVKRFIFLSSIKVNGESTENGRCFSANDAPDPADPYGISKHEAEIALKKLALETGIEVVIIRPTLVYGPQVKANFLSMMRWLDKGVPLPFGAIHNRRSLIGLGNLVDLLITCMHHPSAAGETFLAADGEDLSTTELLRRTGKALGRRVRLLPVPSALLKAGALLLGKRELASRLCGNLQVDCSQTQTQLGWVPPFSLEEELHRTAVAYLKSRAS